jgi:hypothetical protein
MRIHSVAKKNFKILKINLTFYYKIYIITHE